jgi:hypothetical protein
LRNWGYAGEEERRVKRREREEEKRREKSGERERQETRINVH